MSLPSFLGRRLVSKIALSVLSKTQDKQYTIGIARVPLTRGYCFGQLVQSYGGSGKPWISPWVLVSKLTYLPTVQRCFMRVVTPTNPHHNK